MELLGVVAAAVALKAFNADPASFLGSLAGSGLVGVTLVIIILGVIATNVMNLYSAYMTTSTSLDWLINREREEHALVRVCAVAVLTRLNS
jgi:nucleobase:cation symporter-1, NCS1 family